MSSKTSNGPDRVGQTSEGHAAEEAVCCSWDTPTFLASPGPPSAPVSCRPQLGGAQTVLLLRSWFMMAFARLWHRLAAASNRQSPALSRALGALVWLPTAIVFTNYGYTVKAVRGRSMQVRAWRTPSSWLSSRCPRQLARAQPGHVPVARPRPL